MKPGYLTSEFWTTAVLHAVMVIFALHLVPIDSGWTQGLALVCSTIAQCIYTQGRNTLKQSHLELEPMPGFDPQAKPTGTAATGLGALSIVLFLIALSGVLGNLAGCAQTETNRVAQDIVLTESNAVIVDRLVVDHVVSAAQAQVLRQMVHDEKTAEDAYYDAISKGDSNALAAAKAALATATDRLKTELAKYPTPAATTTPTTPATQPAH